MLAQITTTTTVESSSSLSGGVVAGIIGFAVVLGLLHLIGFWKSLDKGGESGAWSLLFLVSCLVPIAFIPVTKLVGRPAWWVVLMYIPIVNIVIMIILSIDMAKSYGRCAAYGVGLALLPFIFWPMLGFGPATYQGRSVATA